MSRILWVVRHAEREDNINSNWHKNANPQKLNLDNSPLSSRGKKQAIELATRFSKVLIDHIFASPFERTVQTATLLISKRDIPIKVEPGLAEALYLCESAPGFEEPNELRKRFPFIDPEYESIYKKPMPKEGFGDDACIPRVRRTLEQILRKYEEANSIVLVSHGSPIGALHEVLVGEWNYVGQATEFTNDSSHLSDQSNLRAY
uniref:Phosphoglycerate mutase n=1 Tax=Globodera rostochiensis TaxID=31243 RepID=A0A914I6R3_GLORO